MALALITYTRLILSTMCILALLLVHDKMNSGKYLLNRPIIIDGLANNNPKQTIIRILMSINKSQAFILDYIHMHSS